MGLFSKFENRMEDVFDNAAENMFDAPISPVQIAKKAEKQMRREKMVGAGKQYAPTLYTVLVNPRDDERFFGYYPTLAGETETYLAAKAADAGLITDGQPLVRFIVDEGFRQGKFEVIAEIVAAPIVEQLRQEEYERYGIPAPQQKNQPLWQNNPGPAPQAAAQAIQQDSQQSSYAATFQTKPQTQAQLINTTTNQSFILTAAQPRITIGRETTNNIVVNDINASRIHAELRLEPQGFWSITDQASTNGTFVNAREISACQLEDGDNIAIGLTNFVFRLGSYI